jgi:hypothetical protein
MNVATARTRGTATALACTSAAAFIVAALAVLVGFDGWALVLALASVVGLALKALFFNPWLSLGVLIDAGLLTAVLSGWPLSLA